jgi:hypothetical protein
MSSKEEWEEIHRRNLRKGLKEIDPAEFPYGVDQYEREYTYEDALSAHADEQYQEYKENRGC